MNLVQFSRLAARHFWTMLACAALAAAMVFWATRNEKKEFSTFSIVNTGLVTGYNIENSQGGRTDYGFTNAEMENILSLFRSRETQRELAVRLLADALTGRQKLDDETHSELAEHFSADFKKEMAGADSLTAVQKIRDLLEKAGENDVKTMIDGKHPLFSLEQIQTLTIKREGTTDMIRIAYSAADPHVCRRTVAELTRLAIAKHRDIKEGQSGAVLEFFEKATAESARDLAGREDNLLNFMVGSKIINYYEQTRYIAAKKEDLDELYFKELMRLAAADSSRRGLEQRLANRVDMPKLNRDLLAQREQLAGVSAKLAALEVVAPEQDSLAVVEGEKSRRSETAQLEKQASFLKKSLRQNAEAQFAINRTPDGAETKNLLEKWLEQWLDAEQTLARLEVFRGRKTEFDRIYSRFAPWGSKLKRLEREIDVAERAYLENLHSFNQARLHKHNLLMSANLRVVDAPFFPEKPLDSKRAMLIILAAFGAFSVVLGAVLALHFLDSSLRDPERAAETTGLELAAAFPALPKNWADDPTLDYRFLMAQASGQLLRRLKLDLRERGAKGRPARVAALSSRSGEGKSFIAALAVAQLRAAGERVLFLRPKSAETADTPHGDDRFFEVDHGFFDKKTEKDLLGDAAFDVEKFDLVFAEMPAALTSDCPADYLEKMDAALFFARADRTWNRADTRALEVLGRVLGRPASLVLNFTKPDELESTLGEAPKRRSFLRRWAKKIATRNFSKG